MATSNTNAGGPSNGDAIQLNSALLLDTAAIREMLGLMKGSLGTMCVALRLPQLSLVGAEENGGGSVCMLLKLNKNSTVVNNSRH